MEMKHTPLPWFTRENTIDGITNYDVMAHDGDEDPWFIAMAMKDANPDRLGKENAAFIVRACNSHYDLLDALRAARDIVASNCDGYYEISVLEDIKAAISKATGEQP